jgi:plastocyanin
MRAFVGVAAGVALGASAWGCTGNGDGMGTSGNPSTPSPSSASDVVTVNVVAIKGAQSFAPNPATLTAGQRIVWHNIDTITHHVVLNDLSVDTGDLAPGASSQPMTIAGGGGSYHCTIHPDMVGSINQNTSPTTPPPSSPPSY